MRPLLAALFLALTLPCAADPLPQVALRGSDPQPIPGTGMMLILTRVDDQRCPADADCYWEGMIRVEVTVLGPDAHQQGIVLCNLCDDGTSSAVVEGIEFTLIGLSPSRDELANLGRPPILTDYTATLAHGPAIR